MTSPSIKGCCENPRPLWVADDKEGRPDFQVCGNCHQPCHSPFKDGGAVEVPTFRAEVKYGVPPLNTTLYPLPPREDGGVVETRKGVKCCDAHEKGECRYCGVFPFKEHDCPVPPREDGGAGGENRPERLVDKLVRENEGKVVSELDWLRELKAMVPDEYSRQVFEVFIHKLLLAERRRTLESVLSNVSDETQENVEEALAEARAIKDNK